MLEACPGHDGWIELRTGMRWSWGSAADARGRRRDRAPALRRSHPPPNGTRPPDHRLAIPGEYDADWRALRKAAREPARKTGIRTAVHARRHRHTKIKNRARWSKRLPLCGNGHAAGCRCRRFGRSAAKLSSRTAPLQLAQARFEATQCW